MVLYHYFILPGYSHIYEPVGTTDTLSANTGVGTVRGTCKNMYVLFAVPPFPALISMPAVVPALSHRGVLCFSGVYLASVIYHEDRVAMTTEDFLPVLEVDESYPSSIHADFHWLMKVGESGAHSFFATCGNTSGCSSSM